jgi:membrane-bound lytic murein transglycosylase MltF
MRWVFAVVLLLAAIGPASAQQTKGPTHPRDGDPLHGVAQLMPKPAFGDLRTIRERRTIRVLVPYSRTNFFFERGIPRGFAYDVFSEYAKFLNRGAKPAERVRVAFLPVPRDKLIPWLVEGRGDVAAGRLTITPGRLSQVDFSAPVETGISEIAVTHRDGPKLSSAEDLAGREVHVRKSSSYHASLLALNERLEASGRPPVRILAAEEFLEDEDLLEQLHERHVEIVIVDDYKRRLFEDVFPDLDFNAAAAIRDGGEIGWAIRKHSPALKASLSAFIAKAKSGERILDYVQNRYFVDNRWIRRPPTGDGIAAYATVRGYFERYAGMYGLEWPRLLAQGFQESGLDQGVRSPVGAIGLMQLMPQTASASPILIPEIHIAEDNVHAGAKYMRHLIDAYFDDPKLDAAERFRFALAAYNAGPNRVARLRKLAAAAGYDPDSWYGNVELAAARHTGQETVTYVSNIEKYLFAFRSTLNLQDLRESTKPAAP